MKIILKKPRHVSTDLVNTNPNYFQYKKHVPTT